MATLPPRAERWMRAPAPPAPPAAWQPRLRKANSWPRRPAEPPEDETPGMVRQLEVQVEALQAEARKLRLARDAAVKLASSSTESLPLTRQTIPAPSDSNTDGACHALIQSAATLVAASAAADVRPASSSVEAAAYAMTSRATPGANAGSGAEMSPPRQPTPAERVMRCRGTPSTSSPTANDDTGEAKESGDEAARDGMDEELAMAEEQARWARARRSEAEKTRRDAERASHRQSEADTTVAEALKATHTAETAANVPVTRAAGEAAGVESAEAGDVTAPAIAWWQQGLERVRERRELQAEVDRLREQVRQMSKQLEESRAAARADVERELAAASATTATTAATATTTHSAASSPQSGSQASPPPPPPRTASAPRQMLGLGAGQGSLPARRGSSGGLLEATLEAAWGNLVATLTPRAVSAATTTTATGTATATVTTASATRTDDDDAAASDDGDSDIDDELVEALSVLSPPMRSVKQQESSHPVEQHVPSQPSPPPRSALMRSPVPVQPPPPPPPRLQRRYVILTTIVAGGRVRCALQVWQSAQQSSTALAQPQRPPTPPRRRPSLAGGMPGTMPGLAGEHTAAPALPAVLHVPAALASPLTVITHSAEQTEPPRVVPATLVEPLEAEEEPCRVVSATLVRRKSHC